jgi:hypothetical protein
MEPEPKTGNRRIKDGFACGQASLGHFVHLFWQFLKFFEKIL